MENKAPVRIKDLAKELGLSPSTVSVVLSGQGDQNRITRETQERVLQTAKRMGYRPKKSAMRSSRQQDTIGIFLPPDFVQGPLDQLVNGIKRFREKNNQNVDLLFTVYDHDRLSQKRHLLQKGSVFSAALLVGTQEADVSFLRSFPPEIPIGLVNREVPGCYCVLIDNYEIGRSAAEHFLRRGHRSVGLIAPGYTSKSLGLRVAGFMDYCREHEKELDRPAIYARAENSPAGGAAAAETLLKNSPSMTGIFFTNSNMVWGAVQALKDTGREVPRDAEIISFGMSNPGQWNDLQITSYAYPVEEMISDAITILHRASKKGNAKVVSLHYPAKCIYRASCPREGFFIPRKP